MEDPLGEWRKREFLLEFDEIHATLGKKPWENTLQKVEAVGEGGVRALTRPGGSPHASAPLRSVAW